MTLATYMARVSGYEGTIAEAIEQLSGGIWGKTWAELDDDEVGIFSVELAQSAQGDVSLERAARSPGRVGGLTRGWLLALVLLWLMTLTEPALALRFPPEIQQFLLSEEAVIPLAITLSAIIKARQAAGRDKKD
jgi:hypothetical protein